MSQRTPFVLLPWLDTACAQQVVDFVRTLGGSRLPALGLFVNPENRDCSESQAIRAGLTTFAGARDDFKLGSPGSFANALAAFGCWLADGGNFDRWDERVRQANDFRGFRFRWFQFAEHMAVWGGKPAGADFEETVLRYFGDIADVPAADVTRILNLDPGYIAQVQTLFAEV